MKKLQEMIESVEEKIKWEQKEIDRYMEDVKHCASSERAEDVAVFMPGYVRSLNEALERQKAYKEQLNMLRFLEKEQTAEE